MAPDSARSASWGARVASPRELAVELGKDDDRAGELLEAAGDQGHLQPALLDLDAGGDELQVVPRASEALPIPGLPARM